MTKQPIFCDYFVSFVNRNFNLDSKLLMLKGKWWAVGDSNARPID